jgi:uncharacterized protein YfdQ (DUF2303 family)
MEDPNSIQAALDAGAALAEPAALDPDVPVYNVIVPHGGSHALISTEKWAPAPRRPKGAYRPATLGAFKDLVNRHQDADRTTIWVHPTSGRVVAVFNDNSLEQGPAWRDHRAVLQMAHTAEWLHWTRLDGQLLSQTAFAEHVEDGLTEIAEPPAADLLELAQSFHAHQTAAFRSAIRLQDGSVQMQYDEEIEAKAGRSGQLSVPSEFSLMVSPFLGETPRFLKARLRYRLSGGRLTLGYRLNRPVEFVQTILRDIFKELDEEFSTVFLGEPEEA